MQDPVTIFLDKPHDFTPHVEVAACYLEFEGEYLFLQRHTGKEEENKWGVPCGKIEKGESSRQAVIRETYEEAGISLDEKQLSYVGKVYVRKPDIDYVYHMYHQKFQAMPLVSLNHEHQAFHWGAPEVVYKKPVMLGGQEIFEYFLSKKCVFCDHERRKHALIERDHCIVVKDKFPVSKGHLLIIPKKHYPQWFETPQEVQLDMIKALNQAKEYLEKTFGPDGYNVGMNCGTAAGQTVHHLHLHLIPRFRGDVSDPTGGVRGVIPSKQNYLPS